MCPLWADPAVGTGLAEEAFHLCAGALPVRRVGSGRRAAPAAPVRRAAAGDRAPPLAAGRADRAGRGPRRRTPRCAATCQTVAVPARVAASGLGRLDGAAARALLASQGVLRCCFNSQLHEYCPSLPNLELPLITRMPLTGLTLWSMSGRVVGGLVSNQLRNLS